MQQLFSLGEVAKLVQKPRHVVEYAIVSGRIGEPRRFLNKRCFSSEEVQHIVSYFETQSSKNREVNHV